MDLNELRHNAKHLAEHITKEAPEDIAAIVVMVDRTTGRVASCAARLSGEAYRAALRALLDSAPAEGIVQ